MIRQPEKELAGSGWTERVCLQELSLPLRIVVIAIKERIDRVGIKRADATLFLDSEKCAVILAKVPVHTPRSQCVLTRPASRLREMTRAGNRRA